MWNDFPYTVFDTRTLDGFKRADNRRLLPRVVFFHSFVVLVLVLLRRQFINSFVFLTWTCAADFNINNSMQLTHSKK